MNAKQKFIQIGKRDAEIRLIRQLMSAASISNLDNHASSRTRGDEGQTQGGEREESPATIYKMRRETKGHIMVLKRAKQRTTRIADVIPNIVPPPERRSTCTTIGTIERSHSGSRFCPCLAIA